MREDNKRIPRSSMHQLVINESTHVNEGRTSRVGHTGTLDGNDVFPTASKGSPLLGNNVDNLNTKVVNLAHTDAGWPLGNEAIAAWASSFRFGLDRKDGERLQEMLERDAHLSVSETHKGTKLVDSQIFAEGTEGGGSFQFINGNQSGYLKPPRQLEKIHYSNRFTAVANACAEEKQGCRASKSSDGLSEVQVVAARIEVAVNDHVTASSRRSEILRRLSDLKAHPSSPWFAPENAVSYHREEAKVAAVRDEFHRRLKPSLPLSKDEYSPVNQYQRKPQKVELSEQEIMSNIRERTRQNNLPSGFRGSPRISAQLASQANPITPTSRFKNGERQLAAGSSTREQIASICRQTHAAASNVINSPSPDHNLSVPAAIPFKWEEEPGKPKTIAGAAHRALARRLPREGIEVSNCIEIIAGSQKDDCKPSTDEAESGNSRKGTHASARMLSDTGNGDPIGRSGSHRYYSRASLSRHYRDGSLGRSSRSYSTQEKEAHIDLDASAAAKFLVEAFESPSRSPILHGSSPTNFSVPFKWEHTPGKAKVETIARSTNLLQLPPRLAVPSYRSVTSLSRGLRASHPLSVFFAPCMTASSPVHGKQSDRALVQYTSSKSLPPKVPSTPRCRKRQGFIGRCSSTPREGDLSESKYFDDKASSHSSSEKASIEHLSTTSSPVLKPRNLVISELRNSSNTPSSPTSILCGPEESSSQTSTSNIAFSSGDLETFTRQTNHSWQSASKSSSSASYEFIEDFAELPSPSYSVPAPPPSDPQRSGAFQDTPNQALDSTAVESSGNEHYARPLKGPPDGANSVLKVPKFGKFLAKLRSQNRLEKIHTPENLSPTLSDYFQCLESTEAGTLTSALTEEVSLLDKQGGPTSSGYLDTDGTPLGLETLPTLQSVAKQEISPSPQASPKRPTRLRYTMPYAAENFLASCSSSGRRQLIQDLSPRLMHQYSGRRPSASHSGSNTPGVDKYSTFAPQANHAQQMSPSPAYAASLELFSPAANIMSQRRKWPATPGTPPAKAAPPKPRRRSRFMVSTRICTFTFP